MRYRAFAALCAALVVAGCGGGGGGTAITVPDGGPEAVAEEREQRERLAAGYRSHPAFERQWGLRRIGADEAYARLAMQHGEDVRPGAGVTVGVFDTGIDTEHPAFAHARIDEISLTDAKDETGILPSHGTAVASVIAGGRESSLSDAAHGVAWGADLAVFALGEYPEPLPEPEPELPTDYFPEWSDIIEAIDDENAEQFGAVLDWRDGDRRVDFLNVSVGGLGIIDGYSETELRSVYDRTIETIAQEGAEEKVIFVWAAGNANGLRCLPNQPYCLAGRVVAASPGYDAGLAARIEEVRATTVAVVAVKEGGEIAEYSNRCGLAAEWCIAAPGDGVSLAWFGPDEETGEPGARGTWTGGGTSFAAPMVTGGLAVMKHRFRGQLSNTKLLARLLETADRTGRYADAKTYGRGLMDLDAATSPVGGERVATGARVAGPGRTLWSTRLGLGSALGDGLERSFASREIVAFDSLGAPFWHRLGSRMTRGTPSTADSRLRDLLPALPERPAARVGTQRDGSGSMRWEAGWLAAPAGLETGHLGLAEDAPALGYGGGGVALRAFSTEGKDGRVPVAGVELSWRKGPIGVRSGWLAEWESALGTRAGGAFGRLAANGVFVGLEGETGIGAWRVFGGGELGLTRPAPEGGLIRELSPVATSALALHAERGIGEGHTLRLSIAQPLRVEAGRASLSLPVGRTRDGRVVSERVDGSLVPGGRQLDLSVRWTRRLGIAGALRAGAGLTLDPGHRAAARPELHLLAGYARTF